MAVKAIKSAGLKELEKVGKTIRLRATQRGYYGLRGEIADIREPGQVFEFAVKDLEEAGPKGRKDRDIIVVDGTKYLLPSWIEDASKAPARTEVDDEEEVTEAKSSKDDDVL